ncbi:MAG: sulfite exporter TauE/SafE family protein [Saprospiraceae bacterium]|nr:sulfite exporter TauE/SafE family protein [Saprospiraceae bacterium]
MSFIDILGYVAALFIGISLGLIGGGGSILTVPVLVYLVGIEPVLATAYSLFVVGSTALVGAWTNIKKKLIHYKAAITFSIPSFIAVFATRMWIVPAIPETIIDTESFILSKGSALLIFFAIVMVTSAYSMLKNSRMEEEEFSSEDFKYGKIALEGTVVGVITGLVGAGGGFLIIPALVLLTKIPMKMAIGTSLLIIAVKSLIGFLGDVTHQPVEWPFLIAFTSVTIVGVLIGGKLSDRFNARQLKIGFAYLVVAMAAYILLKETVL